MREPVDQLVRAACRERRAGRGQAGQGDQSGASRVLAGVRPGVARRRRSSSCPEWSRDEVAAAVADGTLPKGTRALT